MAWQNSTQYTEHGLLHKNNVHTQKIHILLTCHFTHSLLSLSATFIFDLKRHHQQQPNRQPRLHHRHENNIQQLLKKTGHLLESDSFQTSLHFPPDDAGKCGGRTAGGWRLPARCVNGGGRGVTAGVERRVMWSRMTDCWLTDCTLHTLYHGRTAEARTAGRGFFPPLHFLREQTNLKTSWRCHKAKAAACLSLIPVEERGNEILWKKNYMRYFDMSQSCMSPSSGRWWVHRA